MKQFLSLIRKEYYHVVRDGKTLLTMIGIPIVLILIFGFAITNEIKNAKIVVLDHANDSASREIINKLSVSEVFHVEESLFYHQEIEKVFKGTNVKLAIVFPPNFNRDLLHLHSAQVQIIADASDPNTANTLSKYATNIIMEYQQRLMEDAQIPYSILSDIRMLYNPELKGAINFVPGIMALVLQLICVMMTAVSIVKEKEMGTMEVLLVSPINPLLVIFSKVIPYFLLSMINFVVILILSIWLLDIPINGSVFLLFIASTLLIITALSLGLLISNVTQSQQAAMLISFMGLMLPTLLFTGFMFPLENMPIVLQWVSNVVPSKWYYIIVKSIMIKGLGFPAIWKEILILFAMNVFFTVVSFRKYKIRMA